MARPRKKENSWRPPYTQLRKGRWEYRPYLGKGRFGPLVRVAAADATESEVWEGYYLAKEIAEGRQAVAHDIRWLVVQYEQSQRFQAKAEATQKQTRRLLKQITEMKLKGGREFGDVLAEQVTTVVLRKMLDKIAADRGEVTANRSYSYLQGAYKWAIEYGVLPELTPSTTPCQGIKKFSEQAREIYVEDRDYRLVRRKASPATKVIMELAYLSRLRIGEVLRLKKTDWLPGVGLSVERFKRSKDQIIGTTRRLERVVAMAGQLPGSDKSDLLVPTRTGERYTVSGYDSNFRRAMQAARADGLPQSFTTHDLKAKGVSDFEGNKHLASGHRTYSMTAVYDRKKEIVPATR